MESTTYKIPEGCNEVKIEKHDDRIVVLFESNKLPKFKTGDIICCHDIDSDDTFILILEKHELIIFNGLYYKYAIRFNHKLNHINYINDGDNRTASNWDSIQLATEEQKQMLFDSLKAEGKQWNHETLEVEDIRLKPKLGDRYYDFNIPLNNYIIWEDDEYDNHYMSNNMIFKTIEERDEALRKYNEMMSQK